MKEVISIFLRVPKDILVQRIKDRNPDMTEEELELRLSRMEYEESKIPEFDYVVDNINLDDTINTIVEIIENETKKEIKIEDSSDIVADVKNDSDSYDVNELISKIDAKLEELNKEEASDTDDLENKKDNLEESDVPNETEENTSIESIDKEYRNYVKNFIEKYGYFFEVHKEAAVFGGKNTKKKI